MVHSNPRDWSSDCPICCPMKACLDWSNVPAVSPRTAFGYRLCVTPWGLWTSHRAQCRMPSPRTTRAVAPCRWAVARAPIRWRSTSASKAACRCSPTVPPGICVKRSVQGLFLRCPRPGTTPAYLLQRLATTMLWPSERVTSGSSVPSQESESSPST